VVKAMNKPRIGAQLIIWRGRAAKELPKVLDEVAEIGFEGIETSVNIISSYPNAGKLLEDRGLKLIALHLGVSDENVARKGLEILQELGGLYLTFSGAGLKEKTEEKYVEHARFLSRIGELAKDYGAQVCYHNHDYEIVDDAFGMKIILRETSPDLVKLCVNVYWVRHGGMDPATFIKEHLDRIAYLHLKDGTERGIKEKSPEFTPLGQGCIDFKPIIDLCVKAEMKWLIVEQDRTEGDPKECMLASRRYLEEVFKL